MINISLQPEYVASIGSLKLTNTFLTTILVSLMLIVFSILFSYNNKSWKNNIVIGGLYVLVFEFFQLTELVTGNRELTKKILPLVATFFMFIVTANLVGMIPGFLGSLYVFNGTTTVPLIRSPNSDLTTTLALAIFSVIAIQFYSLQTIGFKKYIGRFLNFSSPLNFVLGFFEILSESVKIISFSFRLFGNIFAGEVLLVVIAFLIPFIIPLPFMILEVFVGIIQAFIFAMLTLTFIRTSTLTQNSSRKRLIIS